MKIYYYSGTHWDREWYQTFQGFRKRLVDMTDGLINELESNERYGIFHFDGQTIVLEDYLEIRPEMKERLSALIKQGKIIIGPWYNMPDEFLVSGESLITNLRKGKKLCESYGVEPGDNAYICDIFGHSSQTPQIFASMGYLNTILGRGTNDHTDPAHFVWEALDGTSVCTYRLRDGDGYGDFGAFIRDHNIDTTPSDEFDKALKEYIESEIARTDIPVLLLMDAVDHVPVRPDTPKYIDAIKRLFPEAEVYHCSIDEFDAVQREYADKMPVRRGELCRPAKNKHSYIHVITNTLSSRYPLKKYNDVNQHRLEKWAAPLYGLRKTDMAEGFLDLATKYLLKNHPHDSICGCSIDQVHKDMIYRFDQTSMLCDEIVRPFVNSLKGDLSADALTEGETREGLRLRLYNPLPYRVKKTVVARVELKDTKRYSEPFGYESIPAFRLFDSNDNELVYGYVRSYRNDGYDVSFEAELTPCGVTEFYLKPSDVPTRHVSRLLTSPVSARGDLAAITVNTDGTVDLTDLKTGEVYENLLTAVDNGEIGDGWYHCAPNLDTIVTQTGADIAVIENSAVRTTFKITQKMAMPKCVERKNGTITRSSETVEYRIVHEVTLAKSDRGITVHTVIDNNADDHRLILRLPKTVQGDSYEAAQAFGYVTRTCGDDPDTADWREYGFAQRNMAGICAKRSGKRGLAFVSAYGLHECGVWPNGDMDVTLMRCFSKTVGTHGEPGGQLRERLEYLYRIIPYTEDDCFADLQKEQDLLATGPVSVTVSGGKAQEYRSALEVEGCGIVYSTAGLLPDGASEVRVFNDSDKVQTATVTLPDGTAKASLVELDGRHVADLTLSGRKVSFDLPAFRVATVRFE
ncbi:MAG: hypothetical protein IJY56_01600 [Clostridia bacterium]|nr:hypothetical protein [Clostridia bacterium]